MSASLVGSEMCIRDSTFNLDCPERLFTASGNAAANKYRCQACGKCLHLGEVPRQPCTKRPSVVSRLVWLRVIYGDEVAAAMLS
eukprot:9596736-Alexandrium_andersonii.AAC.1